MSKWKYPKTTGWVEYPFNIGKVNFVSKIDTKGTLYPRIKALGVDNFVLMNKKCVAEVIGAVTKMSKTEIISELERVNEGATEAVIELA